jgi:hypothetical protein
MLTLQRPNRRELIVLAVPCDIAFRLYKKTLFWLFKSTVSYRTSMVLKGRLHCNRVEDQIVVR